MRLGGGHGRCPFLADQFRVTAGALARDRLDRGRSWWSWRGRDISSFSRHSVAVNRSVSTKATAYHPRHAENLERDDRGAPRRRPRRLLDATAALVAEHGLTGVTMSQIAGRAVSAGRRSTSTSRTSSRSSPPGTNATSPHTCTTWPKSARRPAQRAAEAVLREYATLSRRHATAATWRPCCIRASTSAAQRAPAGVHHHAAARSGRTRRGPRRHPGRGTGRLLPARADRRLRPVLRGRARPADQRHPDRRARVPREHEGVMSASLRALATFRLPGGYAFRCTMASA